MNDLQDRWLLFKAAGALYFPTASYSSNREKINALCFRVMHHFNCCVTCFKRRKWKEKTVCNRIRGRGIHWFCHQKSLRWRKTDVIYSAPPRWARFNTTTSRCTGICSYANSNMQTMQDSDAIAGVGSAHWPLQQDIKLGNWGKFFSYVT